MTLGTAGEDKEHPDLSRAILFRFGTYTLGLSASISRDILLYRFAFFGFSEQHLGIAEQNPATAL